MRWRTWQGNPVPDYWDTLAPHHWRIENNYLDIESVRLILGDVREPVLVVGAGQGLIVEELRRQGLRCDGIDLSARMMEYARLRRGLTLVRANAAAMPFGDGTYETVLVATGVIDFMADAPEIETVLREVTRIVSGTGNVFVAFYRFSAAQKRFLTSVGLLRENTLHARSALVLHRLGFRALVARVAKTAGISTFQAALLCIRTGLQSTKQERRIALAMRRVFAQAGDPDAFIAAMPATQPYRDRSAIGRLFDGLSMRIADWQASSSCYLVRVISNRPRSGENRIAPLSKAPPSAPLRLSSSGVPTEKPPASSSSQTLSAS